MKELPVRNPRVAQGHIVKERLHTAYSTDVGLHVWTPVSIVVEVPKTLDVDVWNEKGE